MDNPETITTYPSTRPRGSGEYDLLILTTPDYATRFSALKDAHDGSGAPTEIHTTSEISGPVDAEHIREFVRSQYARGIRFALIGGDDEVLPAPRLYAYGPNGGVVCIPSDFYFGCLDGAYPSEPPPSPDLDLVAEVCIGRAPVDSLSEVDNFVGKTVAYIGGQHAHLDLDLQAGEWAGFGGVSDYGTGMLEQLVDGGDLDGYTTCGIPSDRFAIDRLYDAGAPQAYRWATGALIARINSGVHWINHIGHGRWSHGLKMAAVPFSATVVGCGATEREIVSDIGKLTNADPCFIYSQACDCGSFDDHECLAEWLTAKSAHGAFAVIMNARSGWGGPDTTDTPSQRFHRLFWDGVFNPAPNPPLECRTYGAANQYSKEAAWRLWGDAPLMRYCFYELTLFGDPAVLVQGAP